MCNPRSTRHKHNSNDPDRPSPRKWAANLARPMPLDTKLRYIARNLWIRASRLQDCCGHPGQPGC
jgi:hypothetical protein